MELARGSWKIIAALPVAAWAAIIGSSACGGRDQGTPAAAMNQGFNTPNMVQGTFSGQSMSVEGAASTAPFFVPGFGYGTIDIAMAGDSNICGLLHRSTSVNPPYAQIPSLWMEVEFDGGEVPGTYPIAGPDAGLEAPPMAAMSYTSGLYGCLGTVQEQAVSGTVNVAGFEENTGIVGTFDVMMGVQKADGGIGPGTDHITGSFNAALCDSYTDLLSCYDVACPALLISCN
jgi:hypothetical protein